MHLQFIIKLNGRPIERRILSPMEIIVTRWSARLCIFAHLKLHAVQIWLKIIFNIFDVNEKRKQIEQFPACLYLLCFSITYERVSGYSPFQIEMKWNDTYTCACVTIIPSKHRHQIIVYLQNIQSELVAEIGITTANIIKSDR